MGNYCVVSDIEAEFKGLTFTSDQPVTNTEVEEFIDQTEARVDARIGLLYSTPIDETDSPKSFLIVKNIVTWFVADRVSSILVNRTGNAQTEQNSRPEKSFMDKAKELLKEVMDKTLILPDAETVTTVQVKTETYSAGEEHTFKKGCTQW